MTKRLNVNIDHVATVRQARHALEPSVVAAAMICEQAGADGITVHLRSDRRHIQDEDLYALRQTVTTYLNVEMTTNDEMLRIALAARPDAVTLVPENPNEITTEGGLNVHANFDAVQATIHGLHNDNSRIVTSIFIDPEAQQIEAARAAGAQQIELCTARYAEATLGPPGSGSTATHAELRQRAAQELSRLREAATLAAQYGLLVAAGHGLTYRNISALASVAEITEFNIGHNIIAHAVLVGLDRAVREMRERIRESK